MLLAASRTAARTGLVLARTLATIAVVAAAVFLLTEALPGDATSGLVDRGASPAAVAAARAELGLEQSAPARLWQRLTGLAQGDLGHTARGRPVGDVLARPLRRTLTLAEGPHRPGYAFFTTRTGLPASHCLMSSTISVK